MVRHPFPQGSCNGHVLLVAFLLANSKALSMRPMIEVSSVKSSSSLSQPPASEMSAVDPSSHRRPENALEHFLLAASALTMASVRSASRCIMSSSSTARTSNFLKRIMLDPMIPAEPEGNQTKHTKQKCCSPGKEKGSLTHDENDRSLHTFCGMNQSHTLSTVQSVPHPEIFSLQHLCGDLEEAAPHLKDGTQDRWTLSHHCFNAFEQRLLQLRCVDGVGSVGGSDDDRLPTTLHAIRERQKLGDDALLHFSVGLFTLGSNGVVSSMKTIAGAFFPAPRRPCADWTLPHQPSLT